MLIFNGFIININSLINHICGVRIMLLIFFNCQICLKYTFYAN